MTQDDIITVARSALGIPFRHQGRSEAGLDCAGLLIYVAARLCVECVDVSGYSRRPSGGQLEEALENNVKRGTLERISPDQMQSGDFLMMRFGKDPQHLAILSGDNIIHSYLQVGKVCEHRLDDVWRARIVRIYRLAGVTA